MQEVRVAVIGNPNVGKSTLFNALTGAKQYIGNWPGVTVEKKEGERIWKKVKIRFVDLPGSYGLGATSIDEKIARDYILAEKPDYIVNIIDASNLERNLYLTFDLLEMGVKVIISLNMIDIAVSKGIKIDYKKLSELLGIPIVPTIAIQGDGIDKLCDTIVDAVNGNVVFKRFKIEYPKEIEEAVQELSNIIVKTDPQLPARWIALKLLTDDEDIKRKIGKYSNGASIIAKAEELAKKIRNIYGEDVEIIIAEARYQLIGKIIEKVVSMEAKPKIDISDLIDRVVTHKVLGLPIFISILWAIFLFTFNVAQPLADLIDIIFSQAAEYVHATLDKTNPVLASFIADGILIGFGSVLVFVPNIFFLFLAIAFLEDIGYMARAAFNMDRIMRKAGLHGKSVIPLILGMGCNVPAIMSARTIESEEDRLVTILVNPLIPCSARLPIFVMLAAIFFGRYAATVILSMYLLGFALAAIIALVLRKTFFKGKVSPFVMELPPYRMPSWRTISIHMWNRGSKFLRKAGWIILSVSIILWFLAYMPPEAEFGGSESWLAQIGKLFEPVFLPLGYNWQIAVALIFGFLAKEVMIDAFALLMGDNYESILAKMLTPLQAYALMAFVLIYVPCMATLAVIKSETGSWKWTIFALVYEMILAYLVALLIICIGSLLMW
ncbi:MAG: ferrous iron transport protein B [Candidatus Methanomethylicota archaeon]|uniref:Ferrous iron transport protein B n=1 Tax=Thermoproteota archaeon TaxID=2056631 RepID=A0A497ESD8_9CREN|nr:MAG: ferrous iron transport protein B [Candidatus Verstraetearchaeota archaeon]